MGGVQLPVFKRPQIDRQFNEKQSPTMDPSPVWQEGLPEPLNCCD